MRYDRLFICAVVVLQIGAAISYALRKRYAEAAMFTGAAIANGAALFLEGDQPSTPAP